MSRNEFISETVTVRWVRQNDVNDVFEFTQTIDGEEYAEFISHPRSLDATCEEVAEWHLSCLERSSTV